MKAQNICKKIIKKYENRLTCQYFDGELWVSKNDVLGSIGLINASDCKLNEITKIEAEELLTEVLSKDLCYGVKLMPKESAKTKAKLFLENLNEKSKLFTNSATPYHKKKNAWSFTPLSAKTMDTGVISKNGNEIEAILWASDVD